MSGRAFYCETNSETATFAEQQAQRIAGLQARVLLLETHLRRVLEAGNVVRQSTYLPRHSLWSYRTTTKRQATRKGPSRPRPRPGVR